MNLGRRRHDEVESAMRDFTAARGAGTEDELWLVELEPVYTLGVAGREQHLLAPGGVPVVRTQRGGQVTYHGPGQVVAYPLVDLRRLGIYVKEYVFRIEQAVLDTLAGFGVTGHRVRSAPGIYVRLEDPFGHAVLPPAGPGEDPVRGLAPMRRIMPFLLREDFRPGHQGEQPPRRAWGGAERGHGSRALRAHRPLRVRGLANGRPAQPRRAGRLARRSPCAGAATRAAPGLSFAAHPTRPFPSAGA